MTPDNKPARLKKAAVKIFSGFALAVLGSELVGPESGLTSFALVVSGVILILWGMRDLGMKSDNE